MRITLRNSERCLLIPGEGSDAGRGTSNPRYPVSIRFTSERRPSHRGVSPTTRTLAISWFGSELPTIQPRTHPLSASNGAHRLFQRVFVFGLALTPLLGPRSLYARLAETLLLF